MTHNCPRCEGKGEIKAFSGVMGGVCFKCGGSGKVARAPAKAATKWACEYSGAVLFNIKAKSEAEALRVAVARVDPKYPAFANVGKADVRVFPA